MSERLLAEVVNSFASKCEGVSKTKVAPLAENPAHITLTVYDNGFRDVGCSYLNKDDGTCMSVGRRATNLYCIQLFPGTQKAVLDFNQPSNFARVIPRTIDEKVVEYLSAHPNTIIPREELCLAIWGTAEGRGLDSSLLRIRKQFGREVVTSIYKKGVRFNAPTDNGD